MEMARIANFFSHFEEASEKILRECSNVLKLLDNKDLESFCKLYCEQTGDEDLVLHLFTLPPAPEPAPEMLEEAVEPVKEEKQEAAVEAATDAAEQVAGPGAGLAAELQMMMAEEHQMMMAVEHQMMMAEVAWLPPDEVGEDVIEILNELYMEHEGGGGPGPGHQPEQQQQQVEKEDEEKEDEKQEDKEVKLRCEDEERVGEDRSRGLNNVNWIELLDEASELPCDITFEILDNSFSGANGANGEKKTVIGEIGAHKCFLALCSDVFKVSRLGTEISIHFDPAPTESFLRRGQS